MAHSETGATLPPNNSFISNDLEMWSLLAPFTGKKSEAQLHLFIHSTHISPDGTDLSVSSLVTFINSEPNTEHSSFNSGRKTPEMAPLQRGQ